MTAVIRGTEHKCDAHAGAALPALTVCPVPRSGVMPSKCSRRSATTRSWIWCARASHCGTAGGDDAGWTLKLPVLPDTATDLAAHAVRPIRVAPRESGSGNLCRDGTGPRGDQ
jgi:hypothetical protein